MIITHNGNIIMSDGFILNKVSSTPTPPSFADTKSFQFDGNLDRFEGVGTYSQLDGLKKATFSFWLKPTLTSTDIQFAIMNGSQPQARLLIYSNGIVRMNFLDGGYYTSTPAGSITANVWSHILFCFDKDSSLGNVGRGQVFINGIYVPNQNNNLNTAAFGVSTSGIYIGAQDTTLPYEGFINELAIWAGEDLRSASNVAEIYNGGLPNNLNSLSTAPQPTTWQKMGENAVWDGSKFVMTDVNGGYVNTSIGLLPSDPNPTTDVPLFDNKSFTYDGNLDYFNLGNDASLQPSNFTVCLWVKPSNNNSNRALIHNGAGLYGNSNHGFFLQQSYGNYYFKIGDGTTAYTSFNGGLVANTWQFITLSYDGVNMKTYLDGILQDTLAVPNITYGTDASWNPFYIGRTSGGSQYMDGNLNDASLFNTALNNTDILTIFNGGVPNNISALSPLGYWRAEQVTFDGTDWTLIDQGSGGNNGTSSSMPLTARTSDVPLFDNKSFAYDGITDYIDCGDNDNLSFGDGVTDSPFSISGWIKMDDISGFRLLNKYVGSTYEYSFGTGAAGNLQLYLLDSSSQYRARLQSTFLNTGQWYHIVATYSGVGGINAQDGIKIYVDGVRVDDTSVSVGNYVAMNNTTSDAQIGKLNTSYTDGTINDTSLFNSELTQEQVTQIYNGGIVNDISSLNPLSYWRSEFATWDGSNWTMIDQGSGANNGTSVSMPLTSRTSDVPT